MKKLVAVFLMLFMLTATMLVVSGADETFAITVSGNEVVPAGEQVTYTVTIGNVKAGTSLGIISGQVTYSTDMFKFVSFEVDSESTTVTNWDFGVIKHENGVVDINIWDNALASTGEAENPLTEGKVIVYKLVLEVKTDAAASGSVSSTKADGGAVSKTDAGLLNSVSVTLKQKLATPTGLTWDGSVAKWNAVDNATDYVVQAYKNGQAVGEDQATDGTSLDFKDILKDGGKYTFTVTAVSSQPEYADSDESNQSSGFYTVIGTLATPKIKLTQDFLNGGLEFLITDTNSAGTVQLYVVEIYEKGSDTAVETLETTDKDGALPCDGTKIVAGKSYVATVTAITANENINHNSKKSAKTEAVEALEKVTSIKFKTTPTLIYKEGEKLNLSGMVITLTYQSGTTKDVAYADFGANGLTANLTNGQELTMNENGQAITVFYGVSISVTSSNLTVQSATCAHAKTTTDRKEPTCSLEGYEKITCNDCGATVTNTVLNATGNHKYGEWTVISEPKVNVKGFQERYCTDCNSRDVGEIPALLPGETTTDDGEGDSDDETDPDEFDPDESDDEGEGDEDAGSDMSDLSRIFLIVVIVIFSLILLFIVGGTWMESRRKKAKSAKRNRRPPNRR